MKLSAIKPVHLVAFLLLAPFAAVAGLIGMAAFGVVLEGRRSLVAASMQFFPSVVERAIVDRTNFGAPILSNEPSSAQLQAQEIVRDHRFSFFTAPDYCSLALDFRGLGQDEQPFVVARNLDVTPLITIVFFSGETPDLADYLDGNSNMSLLAERPLGLSMLPPEERARYSQSSGELVNLFNIVSSYGSRRIAWQGEICDSYSYVLFTAVRVDTHE